VILVDVPEVVVVVMYVRNAVAVAVAGAGAARMMEWRRMSYSTALLLIIDERFYFCIDIRY
jgi:hypothetical protein